MVKERQSLIIALTLVLAVGVFVVRADFTGPSSSPPTGDGMISVDGTTLEINGGSGKLTAGTIDPLYTIDGEKYATFMAGMLGVKEEVTGLVDVQGQYEIDFRNQSTGSDLWVFAKTTDLERNFDAMVVNLTPGFDGKVWYEKNSQDLKLTIHTNGSGEVSYRLTAPRFDFQEWPTGASNENADGLILTTGDDGKMEWGN